VLAERRLVINRLPPMALLLIGTVLISFSAVFVKLVDVDPTASGAYRMLIGGAVLALFVKLRGGVVWHGGAPLKIAALAAAFFALDLIFWHRSVIYIGPGLSTLIANFQVFILAGVGVLVFREAFRWQLAVAIPLALAGLGALLAPDWGRLGAEFQLGVGLGLAAAAAYSAYLLSLRSSRVAEVQSSSMANMAMLSLICGVMLLPAIPLLGERFAVPTIVDLGWLAVYGIAAQAVGWVLISNAMAHLPASRIGITLLMQPALAFVWDVVIFDRRFVGLQVAGATLALVAIYLGAQRGRTASG
jgi:drug/metabolite transporter (DMT)-like permease